MSSTFFRAFSSIALAAFCVACGPEDDDAAFADEVDVPDDAYVDETAYGFDDFDLDGDSELDANEFHEWSESPTFAFYVQRDIAATEVEPDQIGALDREVLVDALYAAWDTNDDNALDSTEWDPATRVMEAFSDTASAWIEFDVDGSRTIELVEVQTRLEDDVVLTGIDADANGQIEDEELNQWFFALFDVDESGAVDRDEWRLAELYFDVPML